MHPMMINSPLINEKFINKTSPSKSATLFPMSPLPGTSPEKDINGLERRKSKRRRFGKHTMRDNGERFAQIHNCKLLCSCFVSLTCVFMSTFCCSGVWLGEVERNIWDINGFLQEKNFNSSKKTQSPQAKPQIDLQFTVVLEWKVKAFLRHQSQIVTKLLCRCLGP